jgi:hypothetical protein
LKLKGYNCQSFFGSAVPSFLSLQWLLEDLLDTEALHCFPEEWIRRTAATVRLPNIMKIMKGFLDIDVPRLYN